MQTRTSSISGRETAFRAAVKLHEVLAALEAVRLVHSAFGAMCLNLRFEAYIEARIASSEGSEADRV